MKHTFEAIRNVVRQSPVGQIAPPAPPNRQLSRTETNMLIQVHGHSPDKPSLIGQANGADAVQVYATGLYEGVRKGELRWVTGDLVQVGLDSGVIVEVAGISDDSSAEIEAAATHEAAASRDHIPEPMSGAYEPRTLGADGLAPVPEVTEVDRGLAELSKSELVKIAQTVGLDGRSSMDKSELYEHLRHLPNVGKHLPHD